MGSTIDGQLAQGWYDDPTGRHEVRWFSAGNPTELVRDATRESKDALSAEEQTLHAVSGPGLRLPDQPGSVDGQPGPVAWWDTGVPKPGEPTIADIGVSGYQGYDIIRYIRMSQRVGWRSAALLMAVVVVLLFVLMPR